MKTDWLHSDLIGWLATIVFMTSYIPKSPAMLRRIQALAIICLRSPLATTRARLHRSPLPGTVRQLLL